LEKAPLTKDLSEFIQYAWIGFKGGLRQTLVKIQNSQLINTWQKYVCDKFSSIPMGQKKFFKRRITLALEIPTDRKFTFKEIPELNMSWRTCIQVFPKKIWSVMLPSYYLMK
jgi:hypothetical protein